MGYAEPIFVQYKELNAPDIRFSEPKEPWQRP